MASITAGVVLSATFSGWKKAWAAACGGGLLVVMVSRRGKEDGACVEGGKRKGGSDTNK